MTIRDYAPYDLYLLHSLDDVEDKAIFLKNNTIF
jgi:hypothetical protein